MSTKPRSTVTSPRPIQPRRILRTVDAARYIGSTKSTMDKLRCVGGGPPFYRIGPKIVGYDVTDLDQWLEERKATSTSAT